ncbi:response regulator [Vibrio sp. F74]|uniref:hybrid sensor histidine kinase/response regulator n=1 Tax=Vibrio sp. F74 TaxID=700020 RepID=UPI0035F5F718
MEALRKVYQYAEPNLTLVGLLGVIGYPLYYLVWGTLFPQQYETLPLRLFCSLLFVGIVCRNHLQSSFRQHMHLYYQVVIITSLPFFFFYMLLMNDWSLVWVMSFMSAIFLHILLVHITWLLFLQTFVGLIFATLFAWINKGYSLEVTIDWMQLLPVFFFTYLFGSLCFYRYQADYDSKVSIAKSFGAGIAHEMRNPLSSLCLSIDVIQSILPNATKDNKETYQLSRKEILRLLEVSSDAMSIIHSGNETIDLLLTSIDENRVSRSTFKKHPAQEVVASAIESFSYKREIDRAAVSLEVHSEFEFFGSDTLLKYVVYNLLKNAFHHRNDSHFTVHLALKAEQKLNSIIVTDTGSGIAPKVLENMFKDFYTTGKAGNYGLGLPFCKKVMRSFGGDIQCQSELGKWTQFNMTLPRIDSNIVSDIKSELTKLKSVLFISEQDHLISTMSSVGRFMGVELTTLNIDTTLEKMEYEFEYDLIVVDIESVTLSNNQLDKLESLYSFSEAQLVYLFSQRPIQHLSNTSFTPIWIDIDSWLSHPKETIERLLFDATYVNTVTQKLPVRNEERRTIMIVDDNESLRKFTSILLEKQGLNVIQKNNGLQAVEALETESIDLILMDIEMPVMDGLEASLRIRQSEKPFANIPIIAHTGDNSPSMLNKIDSSSMSGYIVKPADKNQLLDKISDWI